MESVTPLVSKLILRFFKYKFYTGVYIFLNNLIFHLFDNNSFTHELGMFELSTNNFE